MGMQTERSQLLVATTNEGKLRELKGLLSDIPVNILGLRDFGYIYDIEETGSTFTENAALKARGYARQAQIMTIADDSGLEVKALNSRPGVMSARYGGHTTGFDKKIAKLLGELELTGDRDRSARFVCSMAFADAEGKLLFSANGICKGVIAKEARGENGFGYDPIFIPDGFDLTFGELKNPIKQKISHRANAFDQIIPFLRDFMAI